MSAKIQETETKEVELLGVKISFDKVEDYKVITLLEDGKDYVEHKVLAEKLVSSKKAKYNEKAKIEVGKSDTQIL